ncbi:clarin-3-like [Phlebotomus argentipes]|uniref:clarin-3-like n=1 Tax=Phlebotomus argentipes TaxID=94469 RepID=UPI00289322D9|nr:clarin-3-like [Phlebotomus argentipes]
MVRKTHWLFIFATFVISCGSLIMLIVSTTTTEWVIGIAKTPDGTTATLNAHYGLFDGAQDLHVFEVTSHYDLHMTCSFENSICGMSCQNTPDARQNEIIRIMRGEQPSECPFSSTRQSRNAKLAEIADSSPRNTPPNEQFISAALWLATVICLCLTIFFSSMTTVQSLINIISNPIWSIFSVYGLYIWNGLSIAFSAITLILWGSLFATSIRFNIAVRHTLVSGSTLSSDGLASLGFSYWILFGPIVLHAANIGILLWRKWLIEREPPPVAINVAKNDFTILLY